MNAIDLSSQQPETNFSIRIEDPLVDQDLQKQILDRKPDWLANCPGEKKKLMVGKLVWLRILEDIEVSSKIKPLGMIKANDDVLGFS